MGKHREAFNRYRKTPAGKAANARARRKHLTGWTDDLTEAALAAQDGLCAICSREMGEDMCRDHEHVRPPKPRALLCRACNISLGYYETWQKPAGLQLEPYERYIARYT